MATINSGNRLYIWHTLVDRNHKRLTRSSKDTTKNQELENLENLDENEDEISIFDADEPVISTSKSWRFFDKALHLYERHTDPMPAKKQEVEINLELSNSQRKIVNYAAVFLVLLYLIIILVLSV